MEARNEKASAIGWGVSSPLRRMAGNTLERRVHIGYDSAKGLRGPEHKKHLPIKSCGGGGCLLIMNGKWHTLVG